MSVCGGRSAVPAISNSARADYEPSGPRVGSGSHQADITRSAILDALDEHDRLRQDRFLTDYGFGAATKYRLAYNGKLYDSKAIVGVAHRNATGTLLTSSEFSGGDPVIRVLERTGSEVVAIAEQEDTPAEATLLGDLKDLRPHVNRDGKPAFYQPVTLLWAISRARAGEPRLVPYQEASPELQRCLSPFQLDHSAPSPANPWFALKKSPWWELVVPDGRSVTHKDVNRLNLPAGLSRTAHERIVTEPAFADRAVAALAQIIGDHQTLPPLLRDLNLDDVRDGPSAARPRVPTVTSVPLEVSHTERFTSSSTPEPAPRDRERHEAQLQREYARHLRGLGHELSRHRIAFPEGDSDLYPDLYDHTTDELIEVKATADRPTIRLALGQILDYRRYVGASSAALVVPAKPADDLIDLLDAHGIRTIWQTADRDRRSMSCPMPTESAGCRHFRRQCPRQHPAAVHGRCDPGSQVPTRASSTQTSKAARRQGLRLRQASPLAPRARHRPAYRPTRHRPQ